MEDVIMPATGMAMTEGILLRWLKDPGDPVQAGEAVAEVETDKANLEVESPRAGRMGAHLFEPGSMIPIGAVLAHILQDGDRDGATNGSSAEAAADLLSNAPQVDAGHGQELPVVEPIDLPPEMKRDDGAQPVALERDVASARYEPVLLQPEDSEALLDINIEGIGRDTLFEWLETMVLIREFENASDPLAYAGKIPGGMHSAAGQEATAVGAIRALAPTDIVTSSHRSHHHSLAKGLTPRSIMAELYGKATGGRGGRAGHMHLADFSIGLYGSNGIVGGGLGIAMGASLAAKMRGLDQVALGFFGDGGANTGRIWETVNLAALWKLPLIIFCENNLYAVETYVGRAMAGDSIAGRAAGFGLPAIQVDGQDVAAVYRVVSDARDRARRGEGPTFIEGLTYRYQGHNTGDKGTYRRQDEVETWRRTKDPIARLRHALERRDLLDERQFEEFVRGAQEAVQDAVQFAESSPWPDPATALENVTGLETHVRRNV
jgi:TPP-dependent pyruvate/acetoin dehydrogenase alpha subunit